MSNKQVLLLKAEKVLQSIYNSLKTVSTQQELADALKILHEAQTKIDNPDTKITQLKPPSINLNRKGRKSKKGVKSSTERLKIAKELFEEAQEKEIKKKEKEEKQNEEFEKTKRQLEIEERAVDLELKKRKITIVLKGENEKVYSRSNDVEKQTEIKVESSVYDR